MTDLGPESHLSPVPDYVFNQTVSAMLGDIEIGTPSKSFEDGMCIYTAPVGGLLDTTTIEKLFEYVTGDRAHETQHVARGIRLQAYRKGAVARLRRSSPNEAIRTTDHMTRAPELRALGMIFRSAVKPINADLQLFDAQSRETVAYYELGKRTVADVILRSQNASQGSDFDELSSARLKREVHHNRMSLSQMREAIHAYFDSLLPYVQNDLLERFEQELFYDIWESLIDPDETLRFVLTKELPFQIKRMFEQGPEFTTHYGPVGAAKAIQRGDVLPRTRVSFFPKESGGARFVQPVIRWTANEQGKNRTLVHGGATIIRHRGDSIILQSNTIGSMLLASLDNQSVINRQIAFHDLFHYPRPYRLRRHKSEQPVWSVGLAPLLSPVVDRRVILDQIPPNIEATVLVQASIRQLLTNLHYDT